MNITDVDDKIILAARQQYLLSQWLVKHPAVHDDMRDTTKKAFQAYVAKNLPLAPCDSTHESWSKHADIA
ncbi:cysteinyl-tRNA synthetase, partial [Teratosphaeriaceae sp. CCFEE 6253]